MASEMFSVVDNATSQRGAKNITVFGCPAVIEFEVSSLQNRGEWQLELRALNNGAAQFNLARDRSGILYMAVGTCPAIDLSEHVGDLESKQRDLASRILRNLMLYGLTEIRVMKGHDEVTVVPILGERDGTPLENTHDMGLDHSSYLEIRHYAPYVRSGDSDEQELASPEEPIEWN
ncbi:MAG: hypothetical protein ACF8GE_01720 [Phycisphaerales bacterium JB043]